jgi:hypothetical protein
MNLCRQRGAGCSEGCKQILRLCIIYCKYSHLKTILIFKLDGFVKSQILDFYSLQHIEITSPEILFLCFLRLFAAISSLVGE